MFINNWIVIQVEGDRFIVIPGDVVFLGVIPPVIERTMVPGFKYLVIQSQTETGTGQSIRPNLGVFAMAADLAVVPLIGKVGYNFAMTPLESVRTIPDHLERLIPFIIA